MVVEVYKDTDGQFYLFPETPKIGAAYLNFVGYTILTITKDKPTASLADKTTDSVMRSFTMSEDEDEVDEQAQPKNKIEVNGLYVAEPSAPNLSPAIFYNRIEAKDWLAEVGGGTLHAVGEFEWKSLVPAKREANA